MHSHNTEIKLHALKFVAEGAKKQLLAYVSLPLVTVAVFWGHIATGVLIAWLVASLSVAAFRLFLIGQIVGKELSAAAVDRLRALSVCSSLASGILWGIAFFIFFRTDSLGLQIYLLATIFGLSATALILCAYLPAAYYAFAIPSLSMVIARLLLEGNTEHTAFAVAMALYFGIVIQLMRTQSQSAFQSLRLRFENLDLLEKLQHEKKSAEMANAAKSTFLAAASHDLRQPLHAISLFSAALERHADNPEAQKLVEYIHQSVGSLEELLNVLLDISRLDAGVIVPNKVHCSLRPLLERIGTEYEPQATAKNLQWYLQIYGDPVAYTDSALLETSLRNLISNAIRYTDIGSVTVACRQAGDRLLLDVADTGIGIPSESREAIFREFFQLGNTTRNRAKGVGLGLAIVKRIAGLLDCQITIDSAPAQGSRFTLHIPLGDRAKVLVKEDNNTLVPIQYPLNVLVVDDDVAVCQGMRELLTAWGMEAVCVETPAEAYNAVDTGRIVPDIVIADYRLADEQTGIDVIETLRGKIPSPFEAILITGDTGAADIRKLHASQYTFLHKPVKPGKLRALLRSREQVTSLTI